MNLTTGEREGQGMQKMIMHAAVMTAIVLVTVFVLRKIPVVGGFVDQALTG